MRYYQPQPRVKLFLDIETLPCDDDKKDTILTILKVKKNLNLEEVTEEDEELFLKTGLEGTFGRICCIGYIKEDNREVIKKGVLSGSEKGMLQRFWDIASDVERFVGHNIWSFDLPFIYKRSLISGVKPRTDISFARYRNTPIYDTMCEWELWNLDKDRKQKLDTLAKVFNLPSSKDEMDGSIIWQYFQEGKIEDICRYCMKDVELTRQVYYKMTFEDMPEMQISSVNVNNLLRDSTDISS